MGISLDFKGFQWFSSDFKGFQGISRDLKGSQAFSRVFNLHLLVSHTWGRNLENNIFDTPPPPRKHKVDTYVKLFELYDIARNFLIVFGISIE